MSRNRGEVLASQALMLERQGTKGANLAEDHLAGLLSIVTKQAEVLLGGSRIRFMTVDHGETGKGGAGVSFRTESVFLREKST